MSKIATRIVTGIRAADLGERQVEREFRHLLDCGARIRCAGAAKSDPVGILARRYPPRHKLQLFDTVFYLAHLRMDVNARFFVTYVLLGADRRRADASSSRASSTRTRRSSGVPRVTSRAPTPRIGSARAT
jgi:hypothetical protein